MTPPIAAPCPLNRRVIRWLAKKRREKRKKDWELLPYDMRPCLECLRKEKEKKRKRDAFCLVFACLCCLYVRLFSGTMKQICRWNPTNWQSRRDAQNPKNHTASFRHCPFFPEGNFASTILSLFFVWAFGRVPTPLSADLRFRRSNQRRQALFSF